MRNPIHGESSTWNDKEKSQALTKYRSLDVTLSAKTSLMLEDHKAGFRREGHEIINAF